ncbi:uncharacterized protein LOC132744161 [Ruditapes philippinarum]|uniref:uncharacterized protein LOC132744161 n=1 Tax=Ruditapes philippinarum TaxID=129788 RepID=UPI00295B9029|nr:uncharacterized protein LOC132744161 [Ruditapes philippinarum]
MMSGYKFDHKFRGTALIIGNEFKGQGLNERKGCLKDVEMAQELFKRLDFNVTSFKNLSAVDMKKKMEIASKFTYNNDCDCFVLVLSTHGHEAKEIDLKKSNEATVWRHQVLAEDNVPIYVDEIIDIFNDENSVGLKGKPKLFFIQACKSRGEIGSADTYDTGVDVNVVQGTKNPSVRDPNTLRTDPRDSANNLYAIDLTDAEDMYKDWEKDPDALQLGAISRSSDQATDQDAEGEVTEIDTGGSGDSGQLPPSPFDIVPLNCPDDFLIMYPVMSGKIAFRKPKTGSDLIKFLKEKLNEVFNGCNLLQYLTHVSHEIAGNKHKELKQILKTNLKKQKEARRTRESFDPLETFRKHLKGTIKYLSSEENHEKLVTIIGEEHRSQLKGDPSVAEPYLLGVIDNRLTMQQMTEILKTILPFKMTACIVHRLTGVVYFKPKTKKSMMGILWKKSLPKETIVKKK